MALLFSRRTPRKPALFFVHIPKTAGTSFTEILEQLYEPRERCNAYYIQELMEIEPETLSRFGLFVAHIDYGAHVLMPKPLNIITFLRDPVARTISNYEHIKARADHPQHELLRTETKSLYDFTQHPELSRQASNPQTGMLGRDNEFALLYDLAHRGEIELREAKYLSALHRKRPVTKVDLLLAQQRLQHMAFFGITEWFDASLAVFSTLFDIPVPKRTPKQNLSVYRESGGAPQYSEKDISAVRELCRLDNQLYIFAKRQFLHRFENELTRFRANPG